jgi:hypothetical protein
MDYDEGLTELNAAERGQLHNDDERQALLDESLAAEKIGGVTYMRKMASMQPPYPFKDPFAVNNKHEALFCCGRRGKNYLILYAV